MQELASGFLNFKKEKLKMVVDAQTTELDSVNILGASFFTILSSSSPWEEKRGKESEDYCSTSMAISMVAI